VLVAGRVTGGPSAVRAQHRGYLKEESGFKCWLTDIHFRLAVSKATFPNVLTSVAEIKKKKAKNGVKCLEEITFPQLPFNLTLPYAVR